MGYATFCQSCATWSCQILPHAPAGLCHMLPLDCGRLEFQGRFGMSQNAPKPLVPGADYCPAQICGPDCGVWVWRRPLTNLGCTASRASPGEELPRTGMRLWAQVQFLLFLLLHFLVLGGHTGHKTMQFMSRMVGWCTCTSKPFTGS
jgi:hypothetical protein